MKTNLISLIVLSVALLLTIDTTCAIASISVFDNESAATFPRHPAVSPDGKKVAYSYGGDIWTTDIYSDKWESRRITSHPAYEANPLWSPDGNSIVFSTNRDGFTNIYSIPSTSGQPKQITFGDSEDIPMDFLPNGELLFTSNDQSFYPNHRALYSVSLNGETPKKVLDFPVYAAKVSSDGNELLLTMGRHNWWRKNYVSSSASQLIRYDLVNGQITAITDSIAKTSGDDFKLKQAGFPMFTNRNSVIYISERDGTANLWEQHNDRSLVQLTSFKDDGIQYASISRTGNVLVFEKGGSLYSMPIISIQPQYVKLDVRAPFDYPANTTNLERYNSKADNVSIASNGRAMILEVRGNIFASRIVGDDFKDARGRANPLVMDPNFRAGDFDLSPGDDSLIFVSDQKGSNDIYLLYSNDSRSKELARSREIKIEPIVTSTEFELQSPKWSPDGVHFGYIKDKGDLVIRNMKSGKEWTLLTGWSKPRFDWSPDGKWIAYSREDNDYNTDIFIIPSEGGESVNVSRHPSDDNFPVWSADGKKLAFRSRRRDNNWDIHFVFLRLEDHLKNDKDWAEEGLGWNSSPAISSEKPETDDKKGKPKEKEAVRVQIDFEDIHRRIRTVTSVSGEVRSFAISPDGTKFYFASDHEGQNDLYSVKWDGKDVNRITKGGMSPRSITLSNDGKFVRFLTQGGNVKNVNISNSKVEDFSFECFVQVDVIAERNQKFNEIWRTIKDEFYDPNFHGVDWHSIRQKYAELITKASCEEDFADMMRMMFGELNASHTGYYSPRGERAFAQGHLGIDFENLDNELIVKNVLNRSPADRPNVDIQIGDVLIALNGVELNNRNTNLNKLLENSVDQEVELLIKRKNKTHKVYITPVNRNYIGEYRYRDWVNDRRHFVSEQSGERLGYLHVREMSEGMANRFEADLFSEGMDKDALIIDMRNNSGGWTADFLLSMLQTGRHSVTFPREGGPGYPLGRLPNYMWTKPIIVLCNENTFSNGEIFCHAIKTLGRGKLVGVPTSGGVISTGGKRLLDGSGFRIPLRGWYVGTNPSRSDERNMEGNGVVPDIIVINQPDAVGAHNDAQLQSAIREMLRELDR